MGPPGPRPGGAPGLGPAGWRGSAGTPLTGRRRSAAPAGALLVLLAEFAAFVAVSILLGFGWAVLLVLLASAVGLFLLRREGLRAWRRFREAATSGRPPGPHVTEGLIGLSGALLLAVPGLVTGLAGAVLLLPPVRKVVRHRLQSHAERRMSSAEAGRVFGPRQVRVWVNAPEQPSANQPPGEAAGHAETPDGGTIGSETSVEGEVLEGEIVDPPRSRGSRH